MGIIVEQIEIYEPRNPRKTHYFKCVETHFEDLETVWDDRFQRQYGFFRPYVRERTWKVLSAYLKAGVRYDDAAPGGVITVQTFGDFLNYKTHLRIIATDGCFYGNGVFHQRTDAGGKGSGRRVSP